LGDLTDAESAELTDAESAVAVGPREAIEIPASHSIVEESILFVSQVPGKAGNTCLVIAAQLCERQRLAGHPGMWL
jgi:hypothetical protein